MRATSCCAGRWPQALSAEQKANLVSSAGGGDSVAERRARRALIDESIYALEAGDVLAEARKLGPKRSIRAAGRAGCSPRRIGRPGGCRESSSPSFPAPACEKEAAVQTQPRATAHSTGRSEQAGDAAERSRRRRSSSSPRRRLPASSTSLPSGCGASRRRAGRNHRNSSAAGSPFWASSRLRAVTTRAPRRRWPR